MPLGLSNPRRVPCPPATRMRTPGRTAAVGPPRAGPAASGRARRPFWGAGPLIAAAKRGASVQRAHPAGRRRFAARGDKRLELGKIEPRSCSKRRWRGAGLNVSQSCKTCSCPCRVSSRRSASGSSPAISLRLADTQCAGKQACRSPPNDATSRGTCCKRPRPKRRAFRSPRGGGQSPRS